MGSSESEGDEARAALAKFMHVVAKDPEVREQFADSPVATLESQDIGDLGDELRGFLRGLSVEELAFASRLNTTLIDLGFAKDCGGYTLGYL